MRIGIRTWIKVKLDRQNFYLYSAINLRNVENFGLFVPGVNANYTNIFLE